MQFYSLKNYNSSTFFGAKALNGTLGTGYRVPNEGSQVLGTKYRVPNPWVPNSWVPSLGYHGTGSRMKGTKVEALYGTLGVRH